MYARNAFGEYWFRDFAGRVVIVGRRGAQYEAAYQTARRLGLGEARAHAIGARAAGVVS